MRSGIDLIKKGEKAIFPYEKGVVIPEKKMQTTYPCTYGFLKEYKENLIKIFPVDKTYDGDKCGCKDYLGNI